MNRSVTMGKYYNNNNKKKKNVRKRAAMDYESAKKRNNVSLFIFFQRKSFLWFVRSEWRREEREGRMRTRRTRRRMLQQ